MTKLIKNLLGGGLLVTMVIAGGVWGIKQYNVGKETALSANLGQKIDRGEKVVETKEIDQLPEQKFIISKLPELNVTYTDLENGAKRITAEGKNPKEGFEITMIDFSEKGPITAERIRQDIPDMKIEKAYNTNVANGIQALAFNSFDENIGDTFEVWFVREGKLYQALTWPEYKTQLLEILKDLKFQ